ncbi:MAG: MBOAT family protein [Flavobacteriales bacterium]|nr:MAG: MBOAT family protein [Flavobacteriales bacterium]
MLFNSYAFLVFLPLVFLLHWWAVRGSRRGQNILIILASYVFYGWWDWRYLLLLFASSFTDYWLGIYIDQQEEQRKRKRALVLSLVFNLGILGFFKYFNFFIDSAADLIRAFGMQPNLWSLRVILPIGISFYTFQSLSYTIEAYRRNFKPERDPIAYLAFVSFFPHMVAGPIMRAIDLLPQFQKARVFDAAKARDGMRQMLWGFFKKVAVADQCAVHVDRIFAMDPETTSGATLFFGAVFFAFQIYGDFSGYSDIAIGCARLFGIDLMRNFNYPYFSRSIGEFWQRWHISLSTWFRDFLYIPLGGSRVPKARHLLNLFTTFTVSGFWHGANWTFIAWGALHGAAYVPEVLRGAKARAPHATWKEIPLMVPVFLLVLVGWVFFRSPGIAEAGAHLVGVVANARIHPGALLLWARSPAMLLVYAMLLVEWWARRRQHALEHLPLTTPLRWAVYMAIVLVTLYKLDLDAKTEFIYFQF